jgi:hypothetical protein
VTLAHEQEHVDGTRNEAETECHAYQKAPMVAAALGVAPNAAAAVGRFAANAVVVPRQYRSRRCKSGGRYDLHLPGRAGEVVLHRRAHRLTVSGAAPRRRRGARTAACDRARQPPAHRRGPARGTRSRPRRTPARRRRPVAARRTSAIGSATASATSARRADAGVRCRPVMNQAAVQPARNGAATTSTPISAVPSPWFRRPSAANSRIAAASTRKTRTRPV